MTLAFNYNPHIRIGKKPGLAHRQSTPLSIVTQRSGSWLQIEADLPSTPSYTAMELLEFNRALPAGVKVCSAGGKRRVLRTDLPLADPDDSPDASSLSIAENNLAAAARQFAGNFTPELASSGAPEADTADISHLCEEHGWPCVQRDADRWMIDLDVPAAIYMQAKAILADGAVTLTTVIGSLQFAQQASSEAIGNLLLNAGASLRMASPSIEVGEDGSIHALLSVSFAAADAASYLHHALCSLSIGARCLAREIRELQSPSIAGAYLAIVAADMPPASSTKENAR